MLPSLGRAPLSVGEHVVVDFGDSLLLLFVEYVCESEVWLWCFVEQRDIHLTGALDR